MIKVGIIGGGVNSAVGNAHFSALRLSNKYDIVAAAFSRDKNINYETADKICLTRDKVYSQYETMIEYNIGILDAVILLTPTDQHMDQVVYALKNNLNVICEKALAASVNQVFHIQEALSNSKAKLFVIYNYLGYPMVKELRSIVQNGKLGKIFSIQVEMPQEGFVKTIKGELPTPQSWRLTDNKSIPTISLDLGVHLHSLIKYITELKPLRVVAISKSNGDFAEIKDEINAIIECSEDVICNLWYSKISLGHRNGMKIRIYGSLASVFWEQTNPEVITLNDIAGNCMLIDRNSPNIEIGNSQYYNIFKGGHPAGFIEALANYYNDINEALTKSSLGQSNKNVYGIEESSEGLKLFEAINKSSNTKKWVEI